MQPDEPSFPTTGPSGPTVAPLATNSTEELLAVEQRFSFIINVYENGGVRRTLTVSARRPPFIVWFPSASVRTAQAQADRSLSPSAALPPPDFRFPLKPLTGSQVIHISSAGAPGRTTRAADPT